MAAPHPTRPNLSGLVPKTVEAFADRLGYERFNLMGFSFGGLLALRTIESLQHRIDRAILLSPCVSQRALKYSAPRRWMFRTAARSLIWPRLQRGTHRVLQTPWLEFPLTFALSKFSKVEQSILKSKDALKIPLTTLDVLAYTLDEIFRMEYRSACGPFDIPCYFGMSVNDDLLHYGMIEQIVRENFPRLTVQKFTHPYHQPPKPPTFEWLVQEFGPFLEILDV